MLAHAVSQRKINELVEEVEKLRSVVGQNDPQYTTLSAGVTGGSSEAVQISTPSAPSYTSPSSHQKTPPAAAYGGGPGSTYSQHNGTRSHSLFTQPQHVSSGTGMVQPEDIYSTVLA